MELTKQNLKTRWENLKTTQPGIRIRNAASALGVSEAELLATGCGENAIRLRPEFTAILGEISSLGKVMALTRNDEVVHERKGIYLNPSLNNPHVGLFVGEDIDLRIFFKSWASAYAVTEGFPNDPDKKRYSLQFFATDGEAIHKIYLVPQSDVTAFEVLVKKYTADDQSATQAVSALPGEPAERPDSAIDVAGFREAWINLQDTHDFFGLLQKYRISRTQALRLAPEGDFARQVPNDTLRKILNLASERKVPIMVFVGNRGMIQIHTGPVNKLMDHEGWLNVLDPDFNLHVLEKGIAQSWIVRKPTRDGTVTALEIFNGKGQQIIQLFGKRKPGIPEMETWREIVREVARP
ncbi:MAG: ChuX/HutX family heme-like substrate-binding protein [Bacteroidia bacterium]|nr:ChuX/HutX family heme-like substrate-binding protein [Bacteroidia bacterium]